MTVNRSNKKNIIKIMFLTVLTLLIIGFVMIEAMGYLRAKNIPEDVSITEIHDERIVGDLKLYTDVYSSSYWLILNKEGQEKLIMYVGGVRGNVIVKVIDNDMVEVTYDYLDEPNYPAREDTKYHINLAKNETKNVSLLYKLLNEVF